MKVEGVTMGVNYGSNKVRFTSPVPVGSDVRAGATLASVDEVAGGCRLPWTSWSRSKAQRSRPAWPRLSRAFICSDGDVLPQGDEKTQHVRTMFDAIAPRYELVNRVMTFGLDSRWRRRAVADLRLARQCDPRHRRGNR